MKLSLQIFGFLLVCILMLYPQTEAESYPVGGGVERTGIRRLIRLERMDSTQFMRTLPYGSRYDVEYIRLSLMDRPIDSNLVANDESLEDKLRDIIPNRGRGYSVALMDITPGKEVRYAEMNGDGQYQPGSVGKLAVATAFMCEMENVFVDDVQARWDLMKNRVVKGGPFAVYDHHTIPEYDPETERYSRPKVNQQHEFTLYEWFDHMLSVSNNGAASVVWREALLMRVFGQKYPTLTQQEADDYFKNAPRGELRDLGNSVIHEPLRDMGIGHDEWRVGTFFTRGASAIVPPMGGSTGTTRGLMKWLTALESGNVIDAPSSLEIKRLMYLTDRRIRYGSSPVLDSAAVYFKSGSLYGCIPGTSCAKYAGNRMNYMNSVAIVEQPNGDKYLVAMMSNVLGKNSAYDHRLFASGIDRLIRE